MRALAFLVAVLPACSPPADPSGQAPFALCVQDQPCTTSDGCQAGHVDCATGAVRCTALAAQPDGTECAGGRVCEAGACTGCGAGRSCFEATGCRRGTVECSSGAPVCASLADEPDGKPCLEGACFAGACQPTAAADAGPDAPDSAEGPSFEPPRVVRSGCTSGLSAPLLFGLALAFRRRG